MEITFIDKKLEKLANDNRKRVKAHGKLRADKLNVRLDDLRDASTLEDVRYLAGNYHELTGNRKGQWACDLDQPYRLIFQPMEKPVPSDEHGKYIWIEIKGVEIIEITDYHKEKKS
jgi:proteic killer suppression protein